MCSHIIAIAARLKLHVLDTRSAQIPVGKNRNRGRPKNTTAALLTQPLETAAAPETLIANNRRKRN